MRTPSTQDAVLLARSDYSTHTHLCVYQPGLADQGHGAGWAVLSAYPGLGDLTIEITRSETVDDPCASLTATLCRDFGDYSLSPQVLRSPLNLVGGSYVPLLAGGRGVRLYEALAPCGALPADDAWILRFDGHIDIVDPAVGSGTISIQARDLGGKLQDTMIEATRTYGSEVGVSVESVIQSILTDNNTGVTLAVPVSPGWSLKKYEQSKTSVMDAIRALAVTQLGWELRYAWDAATSTFALTLYDIDRAKTAPDFVVPPAHMLAWSSAAIDEATIRNVIKIVYKVDTATGERSSYTASDSASITAHGRRASEIVEDAASQINDEAGATRMANAILADLKDPLVTGSSEILPRPHVELGDLVTFQANRLVPDWSDVDQNLAVVGIQDTFTAEKSSTTLAVRGKPSGGFERWLRLEARPGVGANKALITVDGATSLTAEATVGGITVVYDEPASVEWAYSELYVSTVSGFTPSDTTLYARARTTTFTIGGLVPGTTYYVKIVVVDSAGNRSTASSQTIVATALVGPANVNHDQSTDNLIANSEFSITTAPAVAGTDPPDSWTVNNNGYPDLAPFWAHGVYLDTTVQQSGNASLRFETPDIAYEGSPDRGLPEVTSDYYPAEEGTYYQISAKLRWYYGSASDHGWLPGATILWYDATKTYLSSGSGASSVGLLNVDQDWLTEPASYDGASLAPAGARWFRVRISTVHGVGAHATTPGYIDTVRVGRVYYNSVTSGTAASKQLVVSKTLNFSTATTDLVNVSRTGSDTPDFRVDENGNVGLPNGVTVGGTLIASGDQGLVQVKRSNVNNIGLQIVPQAGASGCEWWLTSTQNYAPLTGQIGTFGDLYWWNETNSRIEWGLRPSTGLPYFRGLVGTGKRVVETGADGWLTVGAAGKYEETSRKNAASGYVGLDAGYRAVLPASTTTETLAVGGLAAQSYAAVDNGWWGYNWRYASGHKRIAAGYAACMMHLAGVWTLRVAPSGAAGSTIAGDGIIAMQADADGKVSLPQQASLAYLATDAGGKVIAAATPGTIAHQLDGASHTVSGLTTGHFLKATGPTSFGFAAHGLVLPKSFPVEYGEWIDSYDATTGEFTSTTPTPGQIGAATASHKHNLTTLGDMPVGIADGYIGRLAGKTTTGQWFLGQTVTAGVPAQADWFQLALTDIPGKGSASGLATLDASSKVVQDPANTSSSWEASKIVMPLATGYVSAVKISAAQNTTLLTLNDNESGATWQHSIPNYAYYRLGKTGGYTWDFQNNDGRFATPGLLVSGLTASRGVATGAAKQLVSLAAPSEVTLTSDVPLPTANTYVDGPSASFGAGTWEFAIEPVCANASGSSATFTARLVVDTTTVKQVSKTIATGAGDWLVPRTAFVTLTGTTTVKMQVASTVGSNDCIIQSGSTLTTLRARQIS